MTFIYALLSAAAYFTASIPVYTSVKKAIKKPTQEYITKEYDEEYAKPQQRFVVITKQKPIGSQNQGEKSLW